MFVRTHHTQLEQWQCSCKKAEDMKCICLLIPHYLTVWLDWQARQFGLPLASQVDTVGDFVSI